MRPLKLRIEGLRSYRRVEEIDFSGAGLVAVLGDTGAGKSSILEALCVALYGYCTWEKSVKGLISSGAGTLTVQLEFEAEQRLWRVTRSTSEGSYPPAVHRLQRLDDRRSWEGKREVDRRVERLVGLDYDTFLRCVVLPQGRFQMLLQASAGQRTHILKGIFRLDQLEEARRRAAGLLEELGPRLEALRLTRAGLLQDPQADAARAERERAAVEEQVARLTRSFEGCRQALSEGETHGLLLAELRDARQAMARVDLAEVRARLRAVAASQAELEERLEQRAGTRRKLERRRDELEKVIARAEDAGLGLAHLSAAGKELEQLAAELGRTGEESEALEIRRGRLQRLQSELDAAGESAQQLEQEAAQAGLRFEEAALRLASLGKQCQQARERWAKVRDEEKRLASLQQRAAKLEQEKEQANQAVDQLARRRAEQKEESLRRQQALESSRRANAAAHASQTCSPGDPCPVCRRALPPKWKPPPAADLDAVAEQAEQAARDERLVRDEHSEAQVRVATALANLENCREELARCGERLEQSRAALTEVLPEYVAGGGDGALRTLEESAEAAQRHHDECRARAEAAGKESGDARVAAETTRRTLQLETEAVESGVASLDQRRRRLQSVWKALPAKLRPGKALRESSLVEAAARMTRRKEELEAAGRELAEVRAGLEVELQVIEQLAGRKEERVDTPLRSASLSLQRLRDAAAALSVRVAAEAPGELPDTTRAAAVAAWAEELAARLGELLPAAAAEEARLREAVVDAQRQVASMLESAGAGSREELEDRLVEARADALTVSRRLEDARRQIAPARELDGRLAKAKPFLEALRETHRLLSDGQFVGHVVRSKQQALLAVASELLEGMSNGRYGFAADFDVVDRLSGQARDVKTLSGGETFLASLSLALGLVELAGRAGGRLEAIFLDEGFGSLDGNALAEAIDALVQQAESGRLVAVISHLRSVAESIDQVLYVSRGPDGSRARWLTPEQRDQLIEEEAGSALVH